MVVAVERVRFTDVDGSSEVFTDDFLGYLVALHDEFKDRVLQAREARRSLLTNALVHGKLPGLLPPGEARTTDWRVPDVPEELRRPGIEISGPASITPMFINALNPTAEGNRAEGDLDDDEDSAGHRLSDTVRAAINRKLAVEGTLRYRDEARNREYAIRPGDLPFFMHRERGLHLDEHDFTIDGAPVSATLLGTALTLFHAGRAQAERGQGIYFYLPKLESVDEARLYRAVFEFSQERLERLRDATIRAIILVESLPAVWQMEEMLHALGPYGAGLNAARWDLKASILEYVMADPNSVWPDRFGIDIKTTDFLADIFRRLVAICLKHDAVPIGGMATALPSRDEKVNKAAAQAITADKEWEARQGFLRGWVAHIYHMNTAGQPFRDWHASGRRPTAEMRDPARCPVRIEVPQGAITQEGTRRNVRTIIEYVEGWLHGRGARSIDSLAGKGSLQPALMEDLATARISVAQTAQRVVHGAGCDDTGRAHDLRLVRELFEGERDDILRLLSDGAGPQAADLYDRATRIGMRWVKNYTEHDFRSLGSYSRADLDRIGTEPEAF